MNGPGPAQRQPHRPGGAMVVTIRVVIVAITVCTAFLLSWIPMLRVAIVRRRARDWALFWVVLVASVAWIIMLGDRYAKTVWNTVGVSCAVGTGLLTTAYYLWSDIRHHRSVAARWEESRAGIVPGAFPQAAFPGPYAPDHPGGRPTGGHQPPPYYGRYDRSGPVVGQPGPGQPGFGPTGQGQPGYGHLTAGQQPAGYPLQPSSVVPPGGAVAPGQPSVGAMPPGPSMPGAGTERPYRPRHARPALSEEPTMDASGGPPYVTPRQGTPPFAGRPPAAGQAPAYGYPHPEAPQGAVPSHARYPDDQGRPHVPHQPSPHQSSSYQPSTHPQAPHPHTPHQRPPAAAEGARRPQRIHEVRAELDELSDLLRRGPGHQGEREE
ncbi:hypothetical protein ACSNOK_28800 [Streptomyces sp. URMC 126]|uniref:hypothetical protein n=1 Tax=Streptomyces sp. URMC 126 TaxID=3423401 RepID=UPI003F19CB8C